MTEILKCLGVSSPDQWLLDSGPDKVSAVAPPDDGWASELKGNYTGIIQRFTLDASAIPVGSAIDFVSVSSRAAATVGGIYAHGLAIGASLVQSADIPGVGYGVFVTTVNALTRPGGGPWALADLDNLEVYTICVDDTANTYLTTLFVSIDYTPGAPPAPSTGAMLLLF
jgi:hypothetical protein